MPEIPALAIFGTSFIVGLSGAASPGPLLAYNIRETVQRGFIAGPVVALGHSLLELAVVAALALGLAQLTEGSLAVSLIGVVGGAFLVGMGWRILQHPEQGAPSPEGHTQVDSRRSIVVPFLGGIVVSLSNPYWAVWWVTVGATFLTRGLEIGGMGVAAFYLGHILSDIGWYSLVSVGIASGKRFITPRLYRGIMQACGTFIIFMGLYFTATGLGWLR